MYSVHPNSYTMQQSDTPFTIEDCDAFLASLDHPNRGNQQMRGQSSSIIPPVQVQAPNSSSQPQYHSLNTDFIDPWGNTPVTNSNNNHPPINATNAKQQLYDRRSSSIVKSPLSETNRVSMPSISPPTQFGSISLPANNQRSLSTSSAIMSTTSNVFDNNHSNIGRAMSASSTSSSGITYYGPNDSNGNNIKNLNPNPNGRVMKPPRKGKTAHNMIEKRYRTNINDKFISLRDCVPSLRCLVEDLENGRDGVSSSNLNNNNNNNSGNNDVAQFDLDGLRPATKLNKATVLTKATEYILHLQHRNSVLEKENEVLRNYLQQDSKDNNNNNGPIGDGVGILGGGGMSGMIDQVKSSGSDANL